jgi:hypothetical protein
MTTGRRFPACFCPCRQAETTGVARVHLRHRHQTSEQGQDAPIEVVWITPLDCLPARSSGSQSGSACQAVADLDPD